MDSEMDMEMDSETDMDTEMDSEARDRILDTEAYSMGRIRFQMNLTGRCDRL